MLELNRIYQGDCLELMKSIDDKSIDMILCDLPYGTTACKWDTIIPFELLWTQYKRIIKDNGAIVLTASQPFTSALVMSNISMFKYCWIWNKVIGSNFINAKIMPLKAYEDVCVFSKSTTVYNPQMTVRDEKNSRTNKPSRNNIANFMSISVNTKGKNKYPINIIEINRLSNELNSNKVLHPTQKPVALFEYLIKTYTNESELVLDNCIGSGTTAIACLQTNRNYIGMELEPKYVEMANKRINEFTKQLVLEA